MTEKPSRLLVTAKDLIKNQNLKEAMVICERIIELDPNNVNGLLLATKCWMDLDIKYQNVKHALERILNLKPNNATAIQGLRKFYEKHFELYCYDAVAFFRMLFDKGELVDKDFEIMMKLVNRPGVSRDVRRFICDCLVAKVRANKDVNCLRALFDKAAQDLIFDKERHFIDEFLRLMPLFHVDTVSSDTDDLDNLRVMETLFKAFIDKMEPEFFFVLLEKNNVTNIYGYAMFADMLCEHYMFSDCYDTLEMGFAQLSSAGDTTLCRDTFNQTLITMHVTNLIQWHNIDKLKDCWPEDAIDYLPKHLWCYAYAVGFDGFSRNGISWKDLGETWCREMLPHQARLCRAIMGPQSQQDLQRQHAVLNAEDLSSFELFLWSSLLEAVELGQEQQDTLEQGSKKLQVHYKVHSSLAEICDRKKEYRNAVEHSRLALEKYWCNDTLEGLVDLHMRETKFEPPIDLLQTLEVENFSEGLLEKFAMCLNHLERVTDAISIAQRLAKQFPSNGHNWQLLGDLYLKRGNINSSFTTYSQSMALTGPTIGIYTRMGSVFSLRYQQTFDENDFYKGMEYFDNSIGLTPTVEALEGQTTVLFLHAEVSLKRMMLSSAVRDLQRVVDLLTGHHDQLHGCDFYMNLIGKTVFLSISGDIDNLIDFNRAALLLVMDPVTYIDPYDFAFNCFNLSIKDYPNDPESYLNYGLLGLHKLNKNCPRTNRGSDAYPELYTSVEIYLKTALRINSNLHDAWKYLGYLYFRHGIVTSRYVFDVQHCLSTAVNVCSTIDSLKDPESAFWLGMLYIQENRGNLAKELFAKIEMDHPVNPIGHIGMYLLAAKDHTVTAHSQIAKVILCYNYRDEESSLDDCNYRINDTIVGLFCDNLGFLVNSRCDYGSFGSSESRSDLILALKTTLNNACIRYGALQAIGSSISPEKHKQYREYGCFLGALELLTGNHQWGKQVLEKSRCDNALITGIQQLDDSWTNKDRDQCVVHIKSLATHAKLSLVSGESVGKESPNILDHSLLVALIHYLSSSPSQLHLELDSVIEKLRVLCNDEDVLLGEQASIIMCLGALISSTDDRTLASQFLETIDKCFSNINDQVEGFSRVLSRVKAIESGAKDAFRYLHDRCLRQPYDMDRWLNLLEFGLEYLADLRGFIDVSQLLFITSRPWCLSPFDVERYARILHKYSKLLTPAAAGHQRHMILRSVKLFPHLCFDLFRSLF